MPMHERFEAFVHGVITREEFLCLELGIEYDRQEITRRYADGHSTTHDVATGQLHYFVTAEAAASLFEEIQW